MNEVNMNRKKNAIITFWLLWEKVFNSVFSLKTIDEDNKLLYYRIRKYQGRTIHLEDGKDLRRGDKVAELHLNNRLIFSAIAQSRSAVHLAVILIREVEPLMNKLSDIIQNETQADIKALYGVSLIYRGTEHLGFIIKDVPTGLFSFFTHFYLKLLLIGLHPQGRKRIKKHQELWRPKVIVMPISALFSRYSEKPMDH